MSQATTVPIATDEPTQPMYRQAVAQRPRQVLVIINHEHFIDYLETQVTTILISFFLLKKVVVFIIDLICKFCFYADVLSPNLKGQNKRK